MTCTAVGILFRANVGTTTSVLHDSQRPPQAAAHSADATATPAYR